MKLWWQTGHSWPGNVERFLGVLEILRREAEEKGAVEEKEGAGVVADRASMVGGEAEEEED